MTAKEATLLDYSKEGRALLSQQSSAPLEGFATYAVDTSIAEFMKDAKNEVEKGHLYLLWHLLYVEEVLEDVAENAMLSSTLAISSVESQTIDKNFDVREPCNICYYSLDFKKNYFQHV